MTGWRGDAAQEVARVRVDLATAAADATPLAEVDLTAGDLTRVQSLLQQMAGAESGRGLLLIEALAERWGATPTHGGKCVWFELLV